jgi:hypothetical protein
MIQNSFSQTLLDVAEILSGDDKLRSDTAEE